MLTLAFAPPEFETLPDHHTDFPVRITVDSAWPLVLVVLPLAVAFVVYLRHRKR